jgi:hypothetical protein
VIAPPWRQIGRETGARLLQEPGCQWTT